MPRATFEPAGTRLLEVNQRRIAGVQLGIGDEVPASAPFEVVERVHLPGHLQAVAVDQTVPAFDVDRVGVAPSRDGEITSVQSVLPKPGVQWASESA